MMNIFEDAVLEREVRKQKTIPVNRTVRMGREPSFARKLVHRLSVSLGAVALTLLFFLVLPLMQTISKPPATDLVLQGIDTANLPPPPPPIEEPQEEEQQKEEKPPELVEQAQPLDLSQLELALNPNPGFSDGWMAGDFTVKLVAAGSGDKGDDLDALFSMADLDQTPRIVYQPSPIIDGQVRKKAPGTVYVLFIVDQSGRVVNPMVQKSSDSIFEKPALTAVKQWKFEPGKRNGQPVRFRMRVPISFPKG